ncbi:TMEM175 family protein [Boudabousia marimammalium]|uniref:DUF1211 domain-containing membrane protein n=1 Tax=Boudabousia marimammalium TaxID=156892 RepID=A0A1Q5PM10_9ACTO|nr:TMEM175 family protein [Boudabousia marimammalium]OKL48079.1 hypothetical protein BM477_06355 [Boudabousia marimammalium]
MDTGRMEAFSDGVLAIVITIMVLKLTLSEGPDWTTLTDAAPVLMAYVVSYLYVGIYWANHHHLVKVAESVSGTILWMNLLWLFWMTLIPVATEWVGLYPFSRIPTLFYGVILFLSALSYHLLQTSIVRQAGPDSAIARRIGKDWKGKLSILAYGLAAAGSLFQPIISYAFYAIVAIAWIVPDVRLEQLFGEIEASPPESDTASNE